MLTPDPRDPRDSDSKLATRILVSHELLIAACHDALRTLKVAYLISSDRRQSIRLIGKALRAARGTT